MRWIRRSQRDFSDEIRAHLALETDRLIAEGLSPEEAAFAARRAFGNVTSATERFHESRRLLWLDQLGQDLRAGGRSLLRYPVVALVAVLSIGAGIGAMTSFLSLRNVIFENPPPLYQEPQQLSKVQVNRQGRPIFPVGSPVPGGLYDGWSRMPGIAMAASIAPRGLRDIRLADRVESVPVRAVTENFFPTLGVAPALGRGFSTDDVAGAPEAVLSHRLWQQWFGGRADAMGTTIWIDDEPHTVVGVMPEQFWFSEMSFPVWTRLDPRRLAARDELQVVVRRPQGMSGDALAVQLRSPLADYSRQLPAGEGPLQLRVSDIKGTPFGDHMSMLLPYLLGVSVALTIMIACANVAILMIAQWTTREAETAMRAALGATRWRLVRALVAESVVLASCAGVLGVCATFALRGILVSRGGDLPFLNLAIDPRLFLQAAVVTILTGVVAGLAPALFETRRFQVDPLRGIATSDRVRQRWSHALVVLEITVTLALLVVTSSMINGYQRTQGAELGFNPDPLMSASVTRDAGISTRAMKERLAQVPGVGAVAASTAVPLLGRGPRERVGATPAAAGGILVEQVSIDSDFLAVLGVPMRAGRGFTSQDSPFTRTAIVNEALARQLFGTGSPIGRQVWKGGTSYDVIGVAADYAAAPIEYRLPLPRLFRPLSAEPREISAIRFLVRASVSPVEIVQPARRALRDSAPGTIVTNAMTLRQMLDIQGQETLAGTAPLFPLIVIGMLLTSSGIYGVLAFAVTRRSRELAVRVAIGASRRDQIAFVALHSLRLLGLGSALGVALTFGLSRVVRAAGGAGSLYDPPWPAFVLPILVVLVVGAVATWLPTRRALRINPALLLRTN
jgi:putative ABC transport system permease protein